MILVLIIVGMVFLHHPFLVIGVEKNFWGATSWTWDLHSSFRDVLQQTNHENLEVVHATGGPKFPAEPSPGDAVFFLSKSVTNHLLIVGTNYIASTVIIQIKRPSMYQKVISTIKV